MYVCTQGWVTYFIPNVTLDPGVVRVTVSRDRPGRREAEG